MGMPSLALTDRDGLYGIPRFLEAAGEEGILPIVGAEIWMEGGHVVLLAGSIEGYRSLCRLITRYRSSSEDRRRPVPAGGGARAYGRCDLPDRGRPFRARSTPGPLPGRKRKPRGPAFSVRGVRGPALRRAHRRPDGDGRRNMGQVAAFARASGVPVVATGEVAYLQPADHRLHEVLVASANLTALPGPGYRPTDQLHLRPAKRCGVSSQVTPRPWRTPLRSRSGAPVRWNLSGEFTCRRRSCLPARRPGRCCWS